MCHNQHAHAATTIGTVNDMLGCCTLQPIKFQETFRLPLTPGTTHINFHALGVSVSAAINAFGTWGADAVANGSVPAGWLDIWKKLLIEHSCQFDGYSVVMPVKVDDKHAKVGVLA